MSFTRNLRDWFYRTLLPHRYALSLNTPSEQVLLQLLDSFAQTLTPRQFLDYAVERLLQLDWIDGVHIHAPESSHQVGTHDRYPTTINDDALTIVIYTPREPDGPLARHIHLLGRIIEQLWRSHRREADLRSQTRARAIHETGAQLTHDIKNLLQSLQNLTGIVGATPPERSAEAIALARRQLPAINKRLHATLQKLRDPGEQEQTVTYQQLGRWWQTLRDRFPAEAGHTELGRDDAAMMIPHELFNTVAENLLENTRRKRRNGRAVDAVVRVQVNTREVALEVSDDGLPVPEDVLEHLFTDTVESTDGLGIGLYQSARMAERLGFCLALVENRDGLVLFRLSGVLQDDDDIHES